MYDEKSHKYFSNPRFDLINLIPSGEDNRLLEIGSGSCETLAEIKKLKLAGEVTGIELVKLPGTLQDSEAIDRLIIGDIERIEPDLEEKYFDVIICGDVIEHLTDPWSVMKKLRKYLKDDGTMIVSIPNIREYHVMYRILVLGDFRYTEQGILDRTHLRFFCKKNILALLKSSGFKAVELYPMFRLDMQQKKNRIINRLTLGIFSDLLASQYVVVSRKSEI